MPEPPDHVQEKRTSPLLVSSERLSHRREEQTSTAAGAARSSGPRKGAPVHRPVSVARCRSSSRSGRLVEEHVLGRFAWVVLVMPVGLGRYVRRGSGWGSLGSVGGLSQRGQ